MEYLKLVGVFEREIKFFSNIERKGITTNGCAASYADGAIEHSNIGVSRANVDDECGQVVAVFGGFYQPSNCVNARLNCYHGKPGAIAGFNGVIDGITRHSRCHHGKLFLGAADDFVIHIQHGKWHGHVLADLKLDRLGQVLFGTSWDTKGARIGARGRHAEYNILAWHNTNDFFAQQLFGCLGKVVAFFFEC